MKSASSTDRAARYRNAARLIEREKAEFACSALRSCGLTAVEFEKMFYADSIRYAKKHRFLHVCYSAWMLNCSHSDEDQDAVGAACRILALCFMAAMVEAGDA